MIKRIHLFDFDGTLVDSSPRYRTMPCGSRIDLQYWIEHEDKTMHDVVLPLMDKFRALVASPEDYAIIATARIWCDLSEQFALENDINPQIIFSRQGRTDTRGGAQLKITGVKKLLNLKQFANVTEIHVYEDNVSYLKDMCDTLGGEGHYFPSNQGH